MPTTRELLYPIHSSYALRASFTPPLPGHTKPKVHAFDGVRGSCGRQPETSAWVHPVLMFHPPTTYPTCRSCQSHGGYPASYPSPELLYRAIGRLLTYAEAHRDPAVLAVALRLLYASPSIEPFAALLAEEAGA